MDLWVLMGAALKSEADRCGCITCKHHVAHVLSAINSGSFEVANVRLDTLVDHQSECPQHRYQGHQT